jgi:acyl-homoserine-lactone acylase
MKSPRLARILSTALLAAAPVAADEAGGWRQEAARVTIVRDDWGIAHVHGHTDADAVFGMIYAQAEDDFSRVEVNYLTALGRIAEVEGEAKIWQDVRQRLFIDPQELKAQYAVSPAWLKALMDAWADGLNYYLATHPTVTPRAIRHFEPWMALSFSEGSIGGDIERVDLEGLAAFYGGGPEVKPQADLGFKEPSGSNGIAISPTNTVNGRALLLINPHTSFFFRSELQVTSDEGLNVYGAATWGQFFIYQGFNAHAGWMHTSSGVDNIDEFAETVVWKEGRPFYSYGSELRPVRVSKITFDYRAKDGALATRTITAYHTHHGPVIRAAGGKWISVELLNSPTAALEQSYLRTKASDLASFMKVAELKANSSNNTLFADDKGEIAYLHPQFVPRRDDKVDYTAPVGGADPATDWKGLHELADLPSVVNPSVGWVFNTNDWPYSAAGPDSPKRAAFPRYMDTAGENSRGVHALRVLEGHKDFTLERLIDAAYDPYLPAFGRLIPTLSEAWDAVSDDDPLKATLAGPIDLLRRWDDRWAADSAATSLAVFWGEALWTVLHEDLEGDAKPVYEFKPAYEYLAIHATSAQKLAALSAAVDRLTSDFGRWQVPWGEINRFQRMNDDIVQTFHDDAPSIPVPFTSELWGSLAAYGSKRYPGTKRYYGTSGNSFVAVVEFGEQVRALAVTAGGESGDSASRHFSDQAERYASGRLREVYFYMEQLARHTERTYRPGE